MNDITFLLSLRIDSIERLENLLCVIDFIHTNFKPKIVLMESDRRKNPILQKLLYNYVDYFSLKTMIPFYIEHVG